MSKHMTAAEAERRYTTLLLLGGTPDEKRFALDRWTAAMRREWYEQARQDKRRLAEAVR